MADVFLSVARGQLGFNKLAVIKRLRQALAEEAAFRNMFLDEARLAARLNHPNIVHTYEVGEQQGVYFIAMEYLEGQSLNKVLRELARRNEAIEPEVAVRIIADALAGLGYAHELRDYDGRPLGVIHRDVSPHNIFVTYDGHTKLVDFGIAKATLSSSETEVGVLKGKVAYMSPEQAMGHRIDARSDLFAMGIVLWELIARQRLMTGDNAANTLHKLINEPIPRVSMVVRGVDQTLDMLVARALEKNPGARFHSAADMRDALESWLVSRPHPFRQEDVGRRMLALFAPVREEVQRQVQKHMAAIAPAASTQELQVLAAASLQRMVQSGANVSGQLLRFGMAGSGSGSGVIANYGALPSRRPAYPTFPPPPDPLPPGAHVQAQSKASSAWLIVITIGCFLLAALLVVVLGLRDRKKEPVFADRASTVAPAAHPNDATSVEPASPVISTTSLGSATTTALPPTAKPRGAAASPPRALAPPAKPAAAPSPAAAEEPGFLTVSSYPWAKVTEGAKVVCPITPCNKVSMSAGTHSVTFENGEKPGQRQSVTVQIKSGETATKNMGFE